MDTTNYRGGTINANGNMAVITFREGWGDPGEWDIDFYREGIPFEKVTRREEDTSAKDVITSALAFVGYDETALEKDEAFLALNRTKIQEQTDRLSTLCSQGASVENIIEQLRQINHMADMSAARCRSIEVHIAVYKAVRHVDDRC